MPKIRIDSAESMYDYNYKKTIGTVKASIERKALLPELQCFLNNAGRFREIEVAPHFSEIANILALDATENVFQPSKYIRLISFDDEIVNVSINYYSSDKMEEGEKKKFNKYIKSDFTKVCKSLVEYRTITDHLELSENLRFDYEIGHKNKDNVYNAAFGISILDLNPRFKSLLSNINCGNVNEINNKFHDLLKDVSEEFPYDISSFNIKMLHLSCPLLSFEYSGDDETMKILFMMFMKIIDNYEPRKVVGTDYHIHINEPIIVTVNDLYRPRTKRPKFITYAFVEVERTCLVEPFKKILKGVTFKNFQRKNREFKKELENFSFSYSSLARSSDELELTCTTNDVAHIRYATSKINKQNVMFCFTSLLIALSYMDDNDMIE